MIERMFLEIVDAHVALLVVPGGHVITSHEPEIKALLKARRLNASVIHV